MYETTYQFSPKVLDRANVLESRMPVETMAMWLSNPTVDDSESLIGKGTAFRQAFLDQALPPLNAQTSQRLQLELMLLFNLLRAFNAEFGLRTANEVRRFIAWHKALTGDTWQLETALDANRCCRRYCHVFTDQVQKQPSPILRAISVYCAQHRSWREGDSVSIMSNEQSLLEEAVSFGNGANDEFRTELQSFQRDLGLAAKNSYLPKA